MTDPKQMIAFLTFAEGLKNVLRHSYTSAGRRESVAEHTWMLCLMAMLIFEEIALEVDQLRVLKMLIIHDLPEIITGDIPTFDKHGIAAQAQQDELEAMEQLVAALPPELRQHILDLHHEYEARYAGSTAGLCHRQGGSAHAAQRRRHQYVGSERLRLPDGFL
jgi:putative hydrolases of HD superfamily